MATRLVKGEKKLF